MRQGQEQAGPGGAAIPVAFRGLVEPLQRFLILAGAVQGGAAAFQSRYAGLAVLGSFFFRSSGSFFGSAKAPAARAQVRSRPIPLPSLSSGWGVSFFARPRAQIRR